MQEHGDANANDGKSGVLKAAEQSQNEQQSPQKHDLERFDPSDWNALLG